MVHTETRGQVHRKTAREGQAKDPELQRSPSLEGEAYSLCFMGSWFLMTDFMGGQQVALLVLASIKLFVYGSCTQLGASRGQTWCPSLLVSPCLAQCLSVLN